MKTEYNQKQFDEEVTSIINEIRDILIQKNLSYGDSALNPIRVFSKSPSDEQINVRLDDKLSRIARGSEYPGDDTLIDIIGYLVMKIIKHRRSSDDANRLFGIESTQKAIPIPIPGINTDTVTVNKF